MARATTRVQGIHPICADLVDTQVMVLEDLPPGVLLDVLVHAGAWKKEGKEPSFGVIGDKGEPGGLPMPMPTRSALSVCRTWRESLMDSPAHMASLFVGAHGGSREAALVAACTMGHEGAVHHLLELSVDSPRANCMDGMALVTASQHGRESIVRLLLDCPRDAPRPDCRNCDALTLCEHTSVRRVLQERLFEMLLPLEQEVVMQLPVQQRREAIVRRVQRTRHREQMQQHLAMLQAAQQQGWLGAMVAQVEWVEARLLQTTARFQLLAQLNQQVETRLLHAAHKKKLVEAYSQQIQQVAARLQQNMQQQEQSVQPNQQERQQVEALAQQLQEEVVQGQQQQVHYEAQLQQTQEQLVQEQKHLAQLEQQMAALLQQMVQQQQQQQQIAQQGQEQQQQ
ncbi:hypothetical protein FOA52_000760 [Chlamydomonas sp. UWO 241]|nr:hypothetical protein FOA52_000760 [Chlamydomonas sp. UWO 241]